MSEIRGHLAESADELEFDGVARAEAERLSVQRFDAPEKAAFLMPLGQQFGTGDRYWGFAAFGLAVVAALGIVGYGASSSVQSFLSRDELRPVLTLLLLAYTYACWRARSFSMLRQSAAVVAGIVMLTGLVQVGPSPDALSRKSAPNETSGLLAAGFDFQAFDAGFPKLPAPMLADLGVPSGRASTQPHSAFGPSVERGEPPVPGMAPVGKNPWELAQEGLLPEVSQMLLSWLFLILMANAAVCWIGCLEHEQKGGVALLQ